MVNVGSDKMVNVVRIKEVEENVVLRKADFENLIDVVESLMETIEVLSDKNLMKQIRESETDIEEGKTFEIKTEDDLNTLFVG
jgi:PHD/YefM family antitoxin component YafN of YafNO toxin-antitoxin module